MAENGKFQMSWTNDDKMGAMKIFKNKCELFFMPKVLKKKSKYR